MWNVHFDALPHPNRTFPGGSFLNTDQFAVQNNILSVAGVSRLSKKCRVGLYWEVTHQNMRKQIAYCKGTVVAGGQRDALSWTDVTFSTSYNKCHEWTSGWTNVQGAEILRFQTLNVIVFFYILWYVLPPVTILDTFVFSHFDQVYSTQKVCVSGSTYVYSTLFLV